MAGAMENSETLPASGNETARRVFDPIGPNYERWSRIFSFFQDPRWRRALVAGLDLPRGSRVLDVACGTGLVTRLLEARGHDVVSLDLTPAMLARAKERGATCVNARAEALPFPDESFDGLTFGYLLRYVDDPHATMRELTRVIKPGAPVGMVEFGLPGGAWKHLWRLYTRICLPLAGRLAGPGWPEVGFFLGPSIEDLYRRLPETELFRLWQSAGLSGVCLTRLSLGGGIVMHGVRK
jgi:demethylmenaquinone methyltransferase/2-methoxy-6-polyprenyl-1,4-benzoquinol methylase